MKGVYPHDSHSSRENRYHRTVQAGQANPGIMRRIQCLRTDDLSLGKTILPSGSPMKDAPAPSKSMMHFYTKSLNWKTWSPFCKPSAAPSMLR